MKTQSSESERNLADAVVVTETMTKANDTIKKLKIMIINMEPEFAVPHITDNHNYCKLMVFSIRSP